MSLRYLLRQLPTDAGELERLAGRLGVSTHETVTTDQIGTRMNAYEVQRRILETLRHRRDSWLWLIALIAALASLGSAAASWISASRCL